MKEEALALVHAAGDTALGVNVLREYTQALVLRSLHESEAFTKIAFVGGTALRFLEQLPRFSEDLDFSLTDSSGYAPEAWLRKVKRDLELGGFDCELTLSTKKTVHAAWVRLVGLLAAAGLAARPEQKLAIKIEIDTQPPAGAEVLRSVVTHHTTFVVRHHAITSLMAGKVHALLTRPYPRGRDWFDLIWYRSRRPPVEPNLDLLQNALDQTQGEARVDAARWLTLVRKRLARLDIDALIRDVRPFVERAADRDLVSRENLQAVLRR